MKIIYIGNNLKSSNPTTIIKLSELLKDAGIDVKVYSKQKKQLFRLISMIFGVFKNSNASYVLIDTYSTFNFYYAVIIGRLCRWLRIPYIPILHGGNLPVRIQKSKRFSESLFGKSLINIAPSPYLKKEFKKHNFQVKEIPNSLNLANYQFKERKEFKPKLFWIRAFDEIYNPKMAIHVLQEVRKMNPNATLCMVGPDKDGSLNLVKSLTKSLNLEAYVEFTGRLTKEDWVLKTKEFDIFINTTNFDNLPVSLIEAMALGLPIVSTNVGGIPHFIEDGKQGFLVPSNDVHAMSICIQKLISNHKLSKSIALNARKKVELYDDALVLKSWLQFLNYDA
ncbi:glycosyltransferase [Urechidicola sp. KH5]